MRLIGTDLSVNLADNEFIGNGAINGGAIYCENSTTAFNIQNDTYRGNTARDGGAILKKSPGINKL